MSKPSWDDAPEWAEWLAMDGDNEWYWFQCKPELSKDTNVWFVDSGKTAFAGMNISTPLERRP